MNEQDMIDTLMRYNNYPAYQEYLVKLYEYMKKRKK